MIDSPQKFLTTKYFQTTVPNGIMLNYQTINKPIRRDNLDSSLKRPYPFVGSFYRLHVIHNGALQFENVNLFLHLRRPFRG